MNGSDSKEDPSSLLKNLQQNELNLNETIFSAEHRFSLRLEQSQGMATPFLVTTAPLMSAKLNL